MDQKCAPLLIYTCNQFMNCVHYNYDIQPYSFGIIFAIHSDSGRLAYKLDGFWGDGSKFININIRSSVHVNACDGITLLLWKSTKHLHCTTSGVTAEGFTWVGTSVQLNRQYAEGMKTMSCTDTSQYMSLQRVIDKYQNKKNK